MAHRARLGAEQWGGGKWVGQGCVDPAVHVAHLLPGRSCLEAGVRGPSEAVLATVTGPGARVMGREGKEEEMYGAWRTQFTGACGESEAVRVSCCSSACSVAHYQPLFVKILLLVEKVKLGNSSVKKKRRYKQYKGYFSQK